MLAPNIEYSEIMDNKTKAKDLQKYDELGVIDFSPVPHYNNFPFKRCTKEIIKKYNSHLNLKTINNSQVIVMKGEDIFIVWE